MIWPKDALQLTYTKLKTRRIRLAVSIFISSVLFALLLGISFTVRGMINSAEHFRDTGFGNRYIASANTNSDFSGLFTDATIISQAESLQKQVVQKKQAEAKALGITYDASSDTPYVISNDGPQGKQKFLNAQVPAVIPLMAQKIQSMPGQEADFIKVAKQAGAKATYSSVNINGVASPAPPYLQVLKDGKENFSSQQQQFSYGPEVNGTDSLPTQWQLMSGELLKPFMLKGQDLKVGSDGSIPVIAPYTAVEQIVGLKPLPASASSDDRLARLQIVRQRSAGYSFGVCYRNSTSAQDVQSAVSQKQEIERNKNNKDYQKPDLLKDVPATACGPIVITKDKRTSDEKTQDAKQLKFRQDFGEPVSESQVLHLRIVGINADAATGGTASVVELFKSVLQSSLGMGWFTPIEQTTTNPTLTKIFSLDPATSALTSKTYYAEFPAANQLKKFLDDQNCQANFGGPQIAPAGAVISSSDASPYQACYQKGKYFSVNPFGSSSVALDDLNKQFNKFFFIATSVVAFLAALIMMGTVGRIVADSRRETAVFRAIGASRSDIWQVYLTYVFILGLMIALISLGLGLVLSLFMDHRYAQKVTVDALVAFNISDLSQKFSLTSFYMKDIADTVGLILLAAISSSILPLLSNIRRNPIRDMRDER